MVSVTEILRLLPDSKKNNARIWGAYSLLWLPLAASAAQVKATVTTQDDSDFVATRIKTYCTDNAAPPVELTAPQATFTFQIGSTNLFPDQNPVHVSNSNVAAAKDRGHELEYPVLIPAVTTLAAFLTNLTAAVMNVRMVIYGVRVFNYQAGSNQL